MHAVYPDTRDNIRDFPPYPHLGSFHKRNLLQILFDHSLLTNLFHSLCFHTIRQVPSNAV